MKPIILKTFIASLIAVAAVNANAAKLYKWVDAKGNISYQDKPPPKSGKILSEKEVTSGADKEQQQSNQNLPEVVVYSVSDCRLCEDLVNVLIQNKVPHIELPLENDRDAQSRILEEAGSIIAPTIFIGEKLLQAGSEYGLKEELRAVGFEIAEKVAAKSDDNEVSADQ